MEEKHGVYGAGAKNSENEGQDSDTADKTVDGIRENGIEEMGAVLTGSKHLIHCLTIIGQIEGHYILPPQNKTTKYEHVIPQLAAIEESSEIKGLLILLNTVGGDVEAGLAIAELIASMKKPTVSLGTFHRRPAGRFGEREFYCPHRYDDNPSGADERPGGRRPAELFLL